MVHCKLLVKLAFFPEPFDYFRISVHYKHVLPYCLSIFTSFVNRLKYWKIISKSCLVVIFTEGRCRMYNSSTIFSSYIVCTCKEESFLVSLNKRHKLVIFNILKILTLHFLYNFIFFLENCSRKILFYNIYFTL